MRILLVSAHPDDAEISCGATIVRIKREYPNVLIRSVYFAPCDEDPKNEGHLEDHRKVIKHLKIDRLQEFKFSRDILENFKQNIRDILFTIREDFQPNFVFCPSPHDFHQDHRTVAECSLTIFRDTSTIFGYEVLRSVTPDFKPNLYIIVSFKDVSMKVKTIKLYKSQLKNRPYFFSPEIFAAQLSMRGVQVKSKWAEAYELLWGRI